MGKCTEFTYLHIKDCKFQVFHSFIILDMEFHMHEYCQLCLTDWDVLYRMYFKHLILIMSV